MKGMQPHSALNEINELTINVSYTSDQIDYKPGTLTVGNNGLEYERQFKNGFIQIPFNQIKQVQVQIAFNRFFRGFYIITKDGKKFNFLTNKTKKVIHVLNRKLDPKLIVRYHK